MAQYDGEIIINTKINTDEFDSGTKRMKAGSAELESAVRKMVSTIEGLGEKTKNSLNKAVTAFAKQNSAYAQQKQKVEDLKAKIEELSSQKVETDEFKEIGNQIDSAEKRLNRLYETQALFLQSGGKTNSSAYIKRQNEIKNIEQVLKDAQIEQEELLNSGQAYQPVDTSALTSQLQAEQDKLRLSGESLQNTLDGLTAKLNQLSSAENKEAGEASAASSAFDGIKSKTSSLITEISALANDGFAKLTNGLKKICTSATSGAKAILNIGKSSKSTNKSLKSGIANILKYALSIQGLFTAIRKLKSAFTDGINNLVQYDKQTNKSISSMMNSLNQLKNSLATAFAPIINIVAPIITKFIGLITNAVNAIGKFLSVLAGKSTYTQAVKGNDDYADSVNSATDATQKANDENKKYLSGLDEMKQYDSGSSDSSSGVTYKEVSIDSPISSFAQQFKDLINADDWEGVGTLVASKLNAALKMIPWNSIQNTVASIVSKITQLLNGFFGDMDLANTVGVTLAQALNTVLLGAYIFVTGFKFEQFGTWIGTALNAAIATFKWGMLGTTIGKAIQGAFDLLEGIVDTYEWGSLASGIATSVNNLLKGIDFKKLATTISKAIEGISTEISNFIAGIDWEAIGKDVLDFLSGIDWKGIFSSLIDVVKSAIGGIDGFLTGIFGEGGATTIEAIAAAVLTVVAAVKAYTLAMAAYNAIQGIVNGTSELGIAIQKTLNAVMSANPIGLIIIAITALIAIFVVLWNKCDAFREFWIGLWDGIKEVAGVVWSAIQGFFTVAWDKIKATWNKASTFFKKVWESIKKIFAPVANYFKGIFKNAWDYVKSVFSTVGEFFTGIIDGVKKIFSGFIDFVTGIFTGDWKKAWNGIKKIFKGVWDVFYTIVKTPINLIIDGINFLWKNIYKAISSIVNTVGDVAGALGDLFGQDWHFKMPDDPPTIPHLAKGAVIPPRSEFMAVLGDQKSGTNIETPENLLRQIMREELGKINTSGGGTYEFTAQINRRTLFDEMIKEGQLRKKTTGRNAFQF